MVDEAPRSRPSGELAPRSRPAGPSGELAYLAGFGFGGNFPQFFSGCRCPLRRAALFVPGRPPTVWPQGVPMQFEPPPEKPEPRRPRPNALPIEDPKEVAARREQRLRRAVVRMRDGVRLRRDALRSWHRWAQRRRAARRFLRHCLEAGPERWRRAAARAVRAAAGVMAVRAVREARRTLPFDHNVLRFAFDMERVDAAPGTPRTGLAFRRVTGACGTSEWLEGAQVVWGVLHMKMSDPAFARALRRARGEQFWATVLACSDAYLQTAHALVYGQAMCLAAFVGEEVPEGLRCPPDLHTLPAAAWCARCPSTRAGGVRPMLLAWARERKPVAWVLGVARAAMYRTRWEKGVDAALRNREIWSLRRVGKRAPLDCCGDDRPLRLVSNQ